MPMWRNHFSFSSMYLGYKSGRIFHKWDPRIAVHYSIKIYWVLYQFPFEPCFRKMDVFLFKCVFKTFCGYWACNVISYLGNANHDKQGNNQAKCEFWQLFWIFSIWYIRDVHRSKSWRFCKHCSPEANMYSEAFIFLCEHNLVTSD